MLISRLTDNIVGIVVLAGDVTEGGSEKGELGGIAGCDEVLGVCVEVDDSEILVSVAGVRDGLVFDS